MSNMSSSQALSRLTLGVAATATATATSASAAIVVFDINPAYVTKYAELSFLSVGSLNFSNGSFATNSPSSFGLDSYYQGTTFLAGTILDGAPSDGGNRFLLAGASINGSFSFGVNQSYVSLDKDILSAGTYYLALSRANPLGDGNLYGWLEFVAVDGDDFSDSYNDITFTRFAFNDVVGQSILAGQTTAIPEASTLGLVGGLFGLVAAAHLRRRKLKQAAASDKFLALAAGEKLN